MHSLGKNKSFAAIHKDGPIKPFVIIFSCHHGVMAPKQPLAAVGLKGTYAHCRQHGSVTVRDVFPADKVGLLR